VPDEEALAGSVTCTVVVSGVAATNVLNPEKVVIIAPCSAAVIAALRFSTPGASASPWSADAGVTVFIRSAFTWVAVSVGLTDHTSAAAADTSGVAMEVPDTYASSLL